MRLRFIPVIAIMVLLAGIGVYRLMQGSAARHQIEMLRDTVQVLRVAAETCSSSLRGSQDDLVFYRARLDSLYEGVRAFEQIDIGGVPADEYDEYMTELAAYRDSAATWADRVGAVEGILQECRSIAQEHNEGVDSLRVLLEAAR